MIRGDFGIFSGRCPAEIHRPVTVFHPGRDLPEEPVTLEANEDGSNGNGGGSDSDSRCFVATATYGTALAPEVMSLRRYRDIVLKPHPLGRALVALYYRLSPPVAALIAKRPALRAYEAALALEANGWKKVTVMEGGVMAWPYPREK